MTEAKMSYLRGFSSGNDYRKAGLFPGNAGNPGFAVSAMWRDRYPDFPVSDPSSAQERFVCGNIVETAPNVFAGWAITVVSNLNQQLMEPRFYFADSSGNLTWFQIDCAESIEAQRTILLQVFFGLTLTIGKSNQAALLFMNGTYVGAFDQLPGYTPAPSDADFIVGGDNGLTSSGSVGAGNTIGFAGMSYSSQVCDDPSDATLSYGQVARIASNQWEDVNAAEDMRDGQEATISDMFSVRRGLPDCDDGANLTWEATKGSAELTRNGSTGMKVEACKPRYICTIVESSLQPAPN